MFKKTDPRSFSKFVPLYLGAPADNQDNLIGTLRAEYQVTSYENVQLQDASAIGAQAANRQYLVHCTQTIDLFNKDGLDASPSPVLDSYTNYPLLVNTALGIQGATGLVLQLLEYSPQTVNTKIQTSGSQGSSTGATQGVSSSNTVGSSTSETNSYGVSVTLSESPSESVNYEHSSTTTSEHSATMGAESSVTRGGDKSNSASMSVKDWGAYALVNPVTKAVVWTFGQEYPWDAVECRLTNGNQSPSKQTEIVIPTAMSANLYDGVSLYPPSHLAVFGIHFVMKAAWLVSVDNAGAAPHADTIALTHHIDYFSGSHMLEPNSATPPVQQVHVYMDQLPTMLQPGPQTSLGTTLDLGLMALDAVGKGADSAIVGFIPRKFTVLPAPFVNTTPAIPFEIFSSSNNLLIKDTTTVPKPAPTAGGFSPGETALTATFAPALPALTMTLYFKVLDVDSNYVLYLKHWVTTAQGVMLTLVINGDTTHAITKYAVALEAEGGENNLTRINLRNLDYSTVDYADYLQLGLNAIALTIQPITPATDSVYQIRAISIEKE